MNLCRWPVLAATAAIALAIAATAPTALAQARPRLRVIDHGAEVEVIATGVQMVAEPQLKVSRERIEVVLFGRPVEVMDVFPDRSVQRVDVRALDPHAASARVLSIKIRGDHARALALLPGARAVQGEDGVHFWIVRNPAAAAAAATTAATRPTPAPVGATAGTAARATAAGNPAAASPTTATAPAPPVAPIAATAGTTAGDSASGTANVTATTANNLNAADTAPATSAPLTGPGASSAGARSLTGAPSTAKPGSAASGPLTGGSGGPSLGRVVLAIGAIVLIGAAAVALRRRRAAAPTTPGPTLDILATRSLGGKNRIVWLGAGDRELVIAVASQKVSLLGQWRRGEADRSAPLGLEPSADSEPLFAQNPLLATGSSPMPRMRNLTSSAASGIMRLRGKLGPVADDVATGDPEADEQWARDILAATGGRR